MVPHWGKCGTSPLQIVPSVFRPVPLLAGAHTSAHHPTSRRMRHSPRSVRLLRWTLIIRICGPPSAQPFLHVGPASRAHWHGARLHRARHALHACSLAICFISWDRCLTRPRSRGSVRVTGMRPAPLSFSRPQCCMSVSSRVPYKAVSSPWYPSGRSGMVSCRILSLGVRPLRRHRCPVGSSRLVSGMSLSIDLRSIHLDLFHTLSSRLATGRFHSACIWPEALGCLPVGCSRLAFCPVHLGSRPAVPSLFVSSRSLAACLRPLPRGWFPQVALQRMSVLCRWVRPSVRNAEY